MADFCKECNNELFDVNESDFGPFSLDTPLEPGEGFLVLCESCGPILVDHNGLKITTALIGSENEPKTN